MLACSDEQVSEQRPAWKWESSWNKTGTSIDSINIDIKYKYKDRMLIQKWKSNQSKIIWHLKHKKMVK